jgi:hypothetical protein
MTYPLRQCGPSAPQTDLEENLLPSCPRLTLRHPRLGVVIYWIESLHAIHFTSSTCSRASLYVLNFFATGFSVG